MDCEELHLSSGHQHGHSSIVPLILGEADLREHRGCCEGRSQGLGMLHMPWASSKQEKLNKNMKYSKRRENRY